MSVRSCHSLLRGLLIVALGLALPSVGVAQTPFPGSSGANAACRSDTLGGYVGLGFAGCTVGAATFYNFSASGTLFNNDFTSSTDVDVADGITLAPGANGVPTIVFSASPNSNLFNLSTGYAQYFIEYYIDPPIDLVGFRLNDAPFVNASVSADICVDNTFEENCFNEGDGGEDFRSFASVTPLAQQEQYFLSIDPNNQSAFAPFDHTTQFLDVLLEIDLDATQSPASLPSFTNGVDPLVTAVPEPDGLALAALGGLVLLGTRMRRRKSNHD